MPLLVASAPALLNAEGAAHLYNNTGVIWYLDLIATESCNRKPITSMAVRRVCGAVRSDEIVNCAHKVRRSIEVSPGVQVYFVPLTFGECRDIQSPVDGEFKALAHTKHSANFRLWTDPISPQEIEDKADRLLHRIPQVTVRVQADDPDNDGQMGILASESWDDLLGNPLLEAGHGTTTLDIDCPESSLEPFTFRQDKGSGPWVLRQSKAGGCCVIL